MKSVIKRLAIQRAGEAGANSTDVLAASHAHTWVEQKEGRDCPVKASDWCQQTISTCECGAIKYHECQAPACIYWAPRTQIIEAANMGIKAGGALPDQET